MSEDLIDLWRRVLVSEQPWVLFKHGTVIVIEKAYEDKYSATSNNTDKSELLAKIGTNLMQQYGPVIAGTPAGDFNTMPMLDGWIVTGHCQCMYNYVKRSEIDQSNEMVVGLLGRNKRDKDGADHEVIHVELKGT